MHRATQQDSIAGPKADQILAEGTAADQELGGGPTPAGFAPRCVPYFMWGNHR